MKIGKDKMTFVALGFFVTSFVCFVFTYKIGVKIKKYRDEINLCSDEFGEAIALFRYGARDEAMETLHRWKERRDLASAPKKEK